ncbi:MAG: MarR family winged helix-turn-helix transcriptional regulator, partial [Deinococcus sp.]|nr:MarR family winged helix-turn-helix transcriptional regulator [Deinococcus sp.]
MNSASLSASASPLPASASGPTGQHYALVQAVLRLSRRFQVALGGPLEAQLGLNIKELLVLAAVADGRDTPGRVAAWQGLPAPTATRLIARLEGLGLLERQ